MASAIESISISGFKSIKELDNLQLSQINVLVGANGSGKSNLISFFEMLNFMTSMALGSYVSFKGGADILLHSGRESVDQISCEIQFKIFKKNLRHFDYDGYRMSLSRSETNTLFFDSEATYFRYYGNEYNPSDWRTLYNTSTETGLSSGNDTHKTILYAMRNWKFFHFHDTSFRAKMKLPSDVNDGNYLKVNGDNIAAFLYNMELNHSFIYDQICETIRLVAPFIRGFIFEPDESNRVVLKWRDDYGNSMMPSQFSDGTIRLICLVALLLQPNPPDFICLDEPELGLHPHAIEIIASLIKERAMKSQVLISTQSPALLDFFEPDDVIVSERQEGESTFRRLNGEELKYWMEEFSLSEAWKSNAFGGIPKI